MTTINLPNNRINLLKKLQPLYSEKMGKKEAPNKLTTISKDLLTKYPKNIFVKIIEIKTFTEQPEKELDQCFPSNYFQEENDAFKSKIYEFLSNNIKDFDNNTAIIQGITKIIDELAQNSFLKKYMNLINIITNNFDSENKFLCEILVTNPFKYKELLYLVDSNLKISPLPKDAQDFYALKNYSDNIKKFTNYTQKNDDNENFKKEVLNRFKTYDQKIALLENKITLQNSEITLQNSEITLLKSQNTEQNSQIDKLKNESKSAKEALFRVQLRDVIKAFVKTLLCTLHINKSKDDHTEKVGELLINIAGDKNKGIEEVLSILKKLKGSKDLGNDEGHHIKNIGFDVSLLPSDIKDKYEKIKTKSNCGIKDCDCVALLLCVKEINDSSEELTKKKYKLLLELADLSVKDWESNKNVVKNLLNSY